MVDEADLLFSSADTQLSALERLLVKTAGGDRQRPASRLLLAGATFPERGKRSVGQLLRQRFKECSWFRSTALHCRPANIEENFEQIASGDAKTRAMCVYDALLRHSGAEAAPDSSSSSALDVPHQRVIVFCNTSASADSLFRELLQTHQNHQRQQQQQQKSRSTTHPSISFSLLSKRVPIAERLASLEAFKSTNNYSAGECSTLRVLVCTDLLSRGLDFGALEVHHVIQAELALNAVQHLHRIGRCGRLSSDAAAVGGRKGLGKNDCV